MINMGSYNITAAEVEWYDDFGNEPTLKIKIDTRYDKLGERIYEVGPELPSGAETVKMYYCDRDGLVDFFVWGGKSDNGFGGRERIVFVKDEVAPEGFSALKVIGGWSSNPDGVKMSGFPEVIHISVHDTRFNLGAIGLRLDVAQKVLDEFLPGIEMIPREHYGHVFKWIGQPSKAEYIHGKSREETDAAPYSKLGPA